MVDSLGAREKNFENKFVLEEEHEFKAKAIAAKLFSIWAANEMSLSKDESEKYSQDILEMSINSNNQEKIIDKVFEDMASKNIHNSKSRLGHIFEQKLEEAITRLQKSVPEIVEQKENSYNMAEKHNEKLPTSYVEKIELERKEHNNISYNRKL